MNFAKLFLVAPPDALKRVQAEAAAELDAFRPAISDWAIQGEL